MYVFLSRVYIYMRVRFQPWREEDTFVSEFAGHVLPPSIFRNFGAPREGNWMGRLSKLQGIYGREENEREREGPKIVAFVEILTHGIHVCYIW